MPMVPLAGRVTRVPVHDGVVADRDDCAVVGDHDVVAVGDHGEAVDLHRSDGCRRRRSVRVDGARRPRLGCRGVGNVGPRSGARPPRNHDGFGRGGGWAFALPASGVTIVMCTCGGSSDTAGTSGCCVPGWARAPASPALAMAVLMCSIQPTRIAPRIPSPSRTGFEMCIRASFVQSTSDRLFHVPRGVANHTFVHFVMGRRTRG